MFRLKTFGALTLEKQGGDVPIAATQRRRLALLAAIANAGTVGIPRDKASFLLWPESDAESARHSLSQLLYSIRQALSIDPVATTSANLRLNSGAITSDIGDFDAALEAGDLEKAARLYTGPFLDGFNPPDSVEFERWMESERARRAKQIATAFEELAMSAASDADRHQAASWWRKVAALDPLDSRIAVSLMKALDAAGNRPGALQHARVHSTLVREELGIEPDAGVLAYANRLEAEAPHDHPAPSALPHRHAATPLQSEMNGAPEAVVETNIADAPSTREAPAQDLQPARARRASAGRWNWRRALGGLAILAIAALSSYVALTQHRNAAVLFSAPAVAVLPFAVHGDSSIAYLGEGLVDLLSSDLDGAGDLRAVDPRSLLSLWGRSGVRPSDPAHGRSIANHFGADLFVLGDVAQAGGRIRISAGLYSRREAEAPLASATVEGERARLFGLVDDLAVKLLAARYQGPRERLMRTAAVTSHSLPALKSYLVGEREFRAGRYARAIAAFEQAVALDTTFALAYYRMSIAAEWEGRPDLQSRGAGNAVRFSSRLSDHDRQLVEALSARRHRNPDRAELLYRQIVAEFPDDLEAWYQLGEVLFHDNANRGRSFIESREAWEHVLALVPDEPDALLHMIRVVARTGSPAALDSTISAALPVLNSQQRLETEAFRAFTIGTVPEQDSLVQRLRRADTDITWQALWRVAVYGRNIEGARRLAEMLVQPRQSMVNSSRGHEALMLLHLAQGQRSAGVAEGAKVLRLYPWSADVGQIYFQSLGFAKNDPAALRRLRSRFDNWIPPSVDESQLFANPQGVLGPHFKAYSAGLLSNALGETSVANEYAAKLAALPAPTSAQNVPDLFAAVVRGGAMRRAGHPAEALAVLENWSGAAPLELGAALGVEPYYGWMRAELLHENGREPEALRWYESRVDLFISEVIYLAPAALRAGEIYERLGDRRKAIDNYRLFVKLWSNADPELQPFVARAREKLAHLSNSAGVR